MWVIVAVSLAFSGNPKVTLVPGREFDTKAECLKAIRQRHSLIGGEGGPVATLIAAHAGFGRAFLRMGVAVDDLQVRQSPE